MKRIHTRGTQTPGQYVAVVDTLRALHGTSLSVVNNIKRVWKDSCDLSILIACPHAVHARQRYLVLSNTGTSVYPTACPLPVLRLCLRGKFFCRVLRHPTIFVTAHYVHWYRLTHTKCWRAICLFELTFLLRGSTWYTTHVALFVSQAHDPDRGIWTEFLPLCDRR